MKIDDNIELNVNEKMRNKSSTNGNDEFILPNKQNLLLLDKWISAIPIPIKEEDHVKNISQNDKPSYQFFCLFFVYFLMIITTKELIDYTNKYSIFRKRKNMKK